MSEKQPAFGHYALVVSFSDHHPRYGLEVRFPPVLHVGALLLLGNRWVVLHRVVEFEQETELFSLLACEHFTTLDHFEARVRSFAVHQESTGERIVKVSENLKVLGSFSRDFCQFGIEGVQILNVDLLAGVESGDEFPECE